MKTRNKTRSLFLAATAASHLLISAIAFAGSPPHFIGKGFAQHRNTLSDAMNGRNYVVELDQQGKIKQVVDAGATGTGKDVKPTQTANSAPTVSASAYGSSVKLPENHQGQAAINYMGGDLPNIAEKYGLTPGKLEALFLADSTVRVDNNKQIFYIDNTLEQQEGEAIVEGTTASPTTIPTVPIASPASLSNAFKLHSKPGASKTIYLDFDGHTTTGTAWSTSTIVAPAYDLGGDSAVFDDNELSNIISIWNRVSEDYIPFDADVTTEPPSADALLRSSFSDNAYGIRVVITKTGTISCSCGGIAYVGVVSMVNNNVYQPAWVFQQSLANNEKYIAEAVSHEAGHNLGLFHDGQQIGATTNGYYKGHGSGETGWAPIMGVGYYKNVTQWSSGVYPGANNQQDDLAALATNGILPRTDLVGNTFATASSLGNIGSDATTNVQTFGVIETADDVDMYMVNTAGGDIDLTVNPVSKGPNLDIQLTLYKSDGTIVAGNAPEAQLSANIAASLPADTYFLAVRGSVHASAGADYGYPVYASLGQYKITGSFISSNIVASPIAVLFASALSGPASLTVNFSALNSVGNGNIVGYHWSFGDGTTSTSASPVHTYSTVGTFTAILTVTNQYLLTSTQTVQVNVSAPPLPMVRASSLRLTVKNTKKIKAQAVINVVDDKGMPVANAVVYGVWSGVYTGRTGSRTDQKGMVVQSPKAKGKNKGAAVAYKINSITVPGYTYNPSQNAKSIATVSWK